MSCTAWWNRSAVNQLRGDCDQTRQLITPCRSDALICRSIVRKRESNLNANTKDSLKIFKYFRKYLICYWIEFKWIYCSWFYSSNVAILLFLILLMRREFGFWFPRRRSSSGWKNKALVIISKYKRKSAQVPGLPARLPADVDEDADHALRIMNDSHIIYTALRRTIESPAVPYHVINTQLGDDYFAYSLTDRRYDIFGKIHLFKIISIHLISMTTTCFMTFIQSSE